MASAPIILVPGFWLGAWAWDEVAAVLRADGHDVTALTLPGLESADADRSAITLSDHVDAIVDAVEAAGRPVVLAVHSATGFSGYAASDRVPERIAAMVYVDTGAGQGRARPRLRRRREADGLGGASRRRRTSTASARSSWRRSGERAVPVPGGVLREASSSRTTPGSDIPTTDHLHRLHGRAVPGRTRKEEPALAFLAGLPELRNVTWIDLPTSHWPMWSKPPELAAIIGDVATSARD